MEYIDILELLKLNGGKLQDVACYGYIREELERPDNIFMDVKCEPYGNFRRMSVFAVKLPKYIEQLKSLGVSSETLYVKGDILVYVTSDAKYPDWYRVTGTLRFGTKAVSNYVTMLEYSKVSNIWYILRTQVADFDASESFPESMMSAVLGESVLPAELENLPAMQAVADTNEINSDQSSELPIVGSPVGIPDDYSIGRESRSEALPYSKVAAEYQRYLEKAECNFNVFLESIKREYEPEDGLPYVSNLISNLKLHMRSKRGNSLSMTGQSLIKKYIGMYAKSSKKLNEEIIRNFDAVVDFLLYDKTLTLSKKANEICRIAFTSEEEFYGGILIALTGMDLKYALKKLSDEYISFTKIVNRNPYLLFLLGVCSYQNAELLTILFDRHNDVELNMYRDMSLVHNWVQNSQGNSTVYKVDEFQSLCVENKSIPNFLSVNIEKFFTNKKVHGYDTSGMEWVRNYTKEIMPLSKARINRALDAYVGQGVGVKLGDYYTSSSMLNKELFIYNTLMESVEDNLDFTKDEIDKCIKEYEKMVGFNLEKEQKEAVHLCVKHSACLSGSAGSGKTTTVGCIDYVLEQLGSGINVKFGAPTGKSARVLQGVVKKETKTFHSLCRIGMEQDDIFSVDEEQDGDENTYYMFDEMSMVTLSVMYKMMKTFGNSRFLFVGDISQLESIGKGNVFADLLRYLPRVFLKVTKRSAERSGITYNSDVINNHSDKNYLPLKNTMDFRMIERDDESIASAVQSICKFYLGEGTNEFNLPSIDVNKDDIQVITPLVKASYKWGSKYLNRLLQPLFNLPKNAEDVISVNGARLIKGDRVIHTTENTYSMQWYKTYKNGLFTKQWGYSVVNGQVGTFMGAYPISQCIFEDEDEPKPEGFRYPDHMRDDAKFDTYDGYFLVVKYYDANTDSDYYTLYRAYLKDEKDFTKFDTGLLDLFYAGSTHKMQGSQARIAICCFGTMSYGSFLSRNMLYTTVTRGKDLVILVGSMNQIEKSRAIVKSNNIVTVGELIAEKC